jgi:hypothetical protein
MEIGKYEIQNIWHSTVQQDMGAEPLTALGISFFQILGGAGVRIPLGGRVPPLF